MSFGEQLDPACQRSALLARVGRYNKDPVQGYEDPKIS